MQFDLWSLHGWLRLTHGVAGFIGLIVFWMQIFSRKGRAFHETAGKIFEICCGLVILSALTSSIWIIAMPLGFNPDSAAISAQRQASYSRQMLFLGSLLGSLSVYTHARVVLSHYW